MSGLSDYSSDELLLELIRRENKNVATEPPDQWCDFCAHFKGAPPTMSEEELDSYNPCSKRHVMKFFMDKDYPMETGFYRDNCRDRKEAEQGK